MSESERVQRWRQRQREEGKKPLTLWLTVQDTRVLEQMATRQHCTPADVVHHLLAASSVTDTETDTPTVADTVTATAGVSDTVTATLRQELPMLVRAIVQELQLQSSRPVTATVTDTEISPSSHAENAPATDTVTATGDDMRAPSVTATVTDTGSHVTDTVPVTDRNNVPVTVSAPSAAVPPFDTSKYRLGKLCKAGHDYHGTRQSLRRNNKAGYCLACNAADARARRQAQRQEVPA